MNRLKLWLYMALVLAAGALNVAYLSSELPARAQRDLDARLGTAARAVDASLRARGTELSAVAALAGRDAAGQAAQPGAEPGAKGRKRGATPAAVGEGPADEAQAASARAAVEAAAHTLGIDLPAGATVLAGTRPALERRAADEKERDATELLRDAIDGKSRRGHVRVGDAIWYAAAAPAGRDAGLVVLVPLDAAWVAGVRARTGADVTVVAPAAKPLSTVRSPAEARAIADAGVAAATGVAGAGRLDPLPLQLDVVPVKLPAVPLLFANAPAQRVRAVALDGLKKGAVVLSLGTGEPLAAVVRYQYTALAALAALLVLGILFGLLVRPAEPPAQIPADLVAAADRIAKSDFSARAPVLAGKLGTLAAALNRAADAAAAAGPAPSLTQEFFKAPEPEPQSPLELPPRDAAPNAAETFQGFPAPAAPDPFGGFPVPAASAAPPSSGAAAVLGGTFEAAPVPAPVRAAPAAIVPPAPAAIASPAPADLLQQAARTASPAAAAATSDDVHWQQVFDEFLRVRGDCGETLDGLTFDRFRAKLEKNREQLVQKYGCKTVRFQVYVKEGKAALKATPVR